ncbi:sex peptide receptor-like [Tetranychus urticae]|uniref:G-protein coupled receptors family 1 profile domain-containing protein n=1 Tax=Tetranychus urticae TaxID=32264 RepID=T1JU76_TETUR|nr:sex peptide receptor-like [Tetranychus urticae]XP_015790945.1 sex peptide receptor-like [Tetranychus urticae]
MRVEPWVEFYFYGVLLTSMCLFGISANTVTLFILNAFNEMRRQPINVYLTVLAIYDNGVLINALLMLGIPALVTNSKHNPSDYLPSVFPSLDSSSPSSISPVNSLHPSSSSSPLSSSFSTSSSPLPVSPHLSSSLPNQLSSVNLPSSESSELEKSQSTDGSTDSMRLTDNTFDYTSTDYLNRLQSLDPYSVNLTLMNKSHSWTPTELINLNPSSIDPPLLFDLSLAHGYSNPEDLPPLVIPPISHSTPTNHHHHQHSLPPSPGYSTELPDDPLNYYVTFVYPLALISQTGSIWTTCLITAERYFAVCHPFRIRTFSNRNRAIWAVVFLSLGAFLYNIPRFIEIEVITSPEGIRSVRQTALRQNRLYYWLYYICLNLALLYIIPLSLLTALNTEIYKAVRRASRNRATLTNQEETELNIASMLVLLVSIFIACNAPAFVVNCMEFFNAPGYEMATIFSNLLVCLNSSINFVIYCIFGKKFRKKLSQVFHCSKLAHQDRLANSYQARVNVTTTALNANLIVKNTVNDEQNNSNNVNLVNNISIATTNSMHAINETYV